MQLRSCQSLTPETETSTHYFFQQSCQRRDFERALRRLLSLHLREVGGTNRRRDFARHRRGEQRAAPEMAEQREEVGRGEHLDIARPRRFRSLRDGADEPALDTARVQRGKSPWLPP